ncbi:MAG: asparagine synthase-related protein [Burkholderiaceae bacterium]|jgi:asparagine synthase (glutamine-hydrolysing)|nr:asparagine synthase-related protein [Burkholderiaceae bacterium]
MTPPSPAATDDLAAFHGWLDVGGNDAIELAPAPPRGDGWHRLRGSAGELAVGPHAVFARVGQRLVVLAGRPRLRDSALQTRADADSVASVIAACDGDPTQMLAGRYALVVLDLAQRRVLLATDRFAVHPICFAFEGRRIAFADRADRVATRAGRRIDPHGLLRYAYFHCLPAPATLFVGVQRLRAAEACEASASGLRQWFHWQPRFEEPAHVALPALREQFMALLEQAVRRELGRVDTTGAFLSGGTDSSTVTGLLGRVSGQPPRAYSIGFNAEGYDEMDYARLAARAFGARHHERYVTPADIVAGIPRVAASYDQPFGNSSALPAYCCALAARDDGIDRILAGDGGDELFGGNERYAKQKLFDLWLRLPRLMRGAGEAALLGPSITGRLPIIRKARSYVQQALTPMPARMETYNLLNRISPQRLLSADLVALVDVDGPAREQAETYGRSGRASLVNRMLAYDWQYTLADSDLPKVCGTAALAGVEVGFPMLDDDLLDFSLRLPCEQKVHGQRLRHFFKDALTGFLPDEIIRKSKHGFGLPFGVWLTREPALKRLAQDSLASLAARNVLAAPFLGELDHHLNTHAGYYGELIWILMILEQWLQANDPDFRVAR